MMELNIVRILEFILLIPVIAAVLGIAIVGVLHVYRFVKYEITCENSKPAGDIDGKPS